MNAMSTGFSLASCCTSVRCIVFGRATTNSSWVMPFEGEPVPADRLDMLRPRVDQRHVEPVMREVAAGIAADRAGPDDDDALVLPSAPSELSLRAQRSNLRRDIWRDWPRPSNCVEGW